MAVDFADKQHDRFHEGFALRNIKLRMSRKLLYISGLLTCFRCQLDFPDETARIKFFKRDNSIAVASYLIHILSFRPLDICADTLSRFSGKPDAVRGLFDSYNDFLGLLGDKTQRDHLEKIAPGQLETDSIYREARNISHCFRDAVSSIFLTPDNPIGELTIKYGVF
jgi:hypothetical protein